MTYTEDAITFLCRGDTLVGILAMPREAARTGVVVIVGGPQYRAGSHRQFVLLSRALAQAGYAVLRFDYRGMGDSEGLPRDFQSVSPDIAAAIDALQRHAPSVRQVALWGLCDGASAALLYCHDTRDSRVKALCLLNPWVRSQASLARTHVKHYYAQRLMQKEFWAKLFRGQVALQALSGLAQNIRAVTAGAHSSGAASSGVSTGTQAPFQHRMAAAWNSFPGHFLLLLSGEDYTAKEFLDYASRDAYWKDAFRHPRLMRHELAGADHTFSDAVSRARVEDLTLKAGLNPLADHSYI